ncbi:MAG: DUF6183 family protein [Acidimicrobiia bacterium]
MNDRRTREAIESSDTDDLLRIVDGACAAKEWGELQKLRTLLAEAIERGRQLWGIDQHIRYRMALEGPPVVAASAVEEGPARFALGPLTEVVANHHTFAELAPHLPLGPNRAAVAAERTVARERVDADGLGPTELPLELKSWEPVYSLPTYHKDRVESPAPPRPPMEPIALPGEARVVDDLASTDALLALVLPWLEESNGRGQAVCVDGPPPAALRALSVPRAEMAPIATAGAIAQMAWAAASGGAMGRRRGAAYGRFATWFALVALAGWEWPASAEEVEDAVSRLQWFAWTDLAPELGWSLHLAAHDPGEGLSWAIGARDAH